MIFSSRVLFAALLVYLGWMFANAYSQKVGNIYIFLILSGSLMYNREGLWKELQTFGVV